jgi:hypothetical protein
VNKWGFEQMRFFPIPVVVLVCAWFVFVVCAFSDAGSSLPSFVVLVYCGLLWGVVWLIRFVVFLARQRRGSIPVQPFRRALLYWSFEPAALCLTAVLVYTGILYHLRFRLSRPALESYAAEIVAGRKQPHGFATPRRWVGLYRVRETELLPDGVVRIITAPSGFDDAGFTSSPVSSPPVVGEDSYTHITGSWYHWHRSW